MPTTAVPPNHVPPNHHAGHQPFAGLTGLAAALSMLVGRDDAAQRAAELIDLKAADTLVDLGCGPGAGARLAARRGAEVIAVDPAAVMLRVARRVPVRGRRVTWSEGSAEASGLDDDVATAVWGLSTVHHWRDLDAAIDEADRVLRPGGRFLAMERLVAPGAGGLASHGWTPGQRDDFARLLGQHGFDEVATGDATTRRGPVVWVRARTAPPTSSARR